MINRHSWKFSKSTMTTCLRVRGNCEMHVQTMECVLQPTIPVQDRYIRLMHLRDRFRTATSTASQIPGLRRISSQTVISCLRQAGLVTRRPVRRNVLTAHHLAGRLQCCQEHIRRRRAQWSTVLFSDKSRFLLFRADGRSRAYRSHNERYAANCVLEHDRFGGDSIKVWAGIHHDGRTALMRVNGGVLSVQIYRGEILQHHVHPRINVVAGGIFQHDNTRPINDFKSRVTEPFLENIYIVCVY